MAFTAKTLYGFSVASNKYISGCQSQGIDYGAQGLELGGDGNAYASFLAMISGKVSGTLETGAIKSALTAVGALGAPLDSASFWFQNFGADGFPLGALSHDKLTIASGLIIPTTLTLAQGAAASIGYMVYGRDNGTNPVVVHATGVTLPTDVPMAEAYTLGPVKLGAALLDCVQSVTVDFGLVVEGVRCNGGGYERHLRVSAVRPSIRIQSAMPINMTAITASGTGSSAAAAVVSARALSNYGMFVADATAGHITISLGAWQALPGSDAVQMGGLWASDFVIRPSRPGVTAQLVVNTAAALPA